MNIIFLDLEQVLTLHLDQIEKYGGSHGIRDLKLLESAIFRPQATFGGEDLYSTIFDKAAALLHSIILNHPFLDGNKRIGIVSAIVFLELNGFRFKATNKQVVQNATKIATKKMDMVEIAVWLEKNSKKI